MCYVIRGGVKHDHPPVGFCLRQRNAFDGAFVVGDAGFDFFQPIGVNGSAVFVADFEPVVGGRIVGGGDVDRARRVFGHDGVRNHGRRGGAVRQVDV